ncbi:MAG TPA: DegT/DnrJ/EryC1/StrS family aminotransferase [Candidatus Saccharimonadales bacterium]|nr:DegT/DnrJ/EryC1/StrS family aminotransferase [Candidatus Saccharimonadales bacterium]
MDHKSERINVTKAFLPPIEEYNSYLKKIWQNNQLTNHGPLLKEFEKEASEYLDVENFHFVTNGTIALQLALRSLDITEGEVITTPFSYVATTSAILWEGAKPVYVDIDPETLCIDSDKIEAAITEKTKAILPVHVFGNPCDIEAIDKIAKKHNLKIIYDGAHAFGVKYKNKPLLSHGDISICSFHSTKRFHTIEGGCVIAKDKKISDEIELIKKFGHIGDDHYRLGINAKASEYQAAMGLCNLKYIEENIQKRKEKIEIYNKLISNQMQRPKLNKETEYTFAYYPVVLESEEKLLDILNKLKNENIFPRRYFYPSLNTLPYIDKVQDCPISEDISKKILCLPLFEDLEESIINKICEILKS